MLEQARCWEEISIRVLTKQEAYFNVYKGTDYEQIVTERHKK